MAAGTTALWFNRPTMPRHNPDAVKRFRRLARLVGALVGLLGGVFYGLWIISNSQGTLHSDRTVALIALLAAGATGGVSGALAGPLLSVEPFLWLERTLETAPAGELIGGVAGLLIGLVVSALVAVLLSGIPAGVGYLIALVLAVAFVYVGVHTGMRRRVDVASLFTQGARRAAAGASSGQASVVDDELPPPQDGPPVLVDTSVLIDGRILDIVATGFIPGRLVIPTFVLEELQRVADAGDSMRRARGRRGLAVVDGLKHSPDVVCEFLDTDIPGAADVDWRLIKLARRMGAAVMTNDLNLNKLARVEGLRVLNLNDLANALKPIVSAGETMEVTIVKDGKEPHQGVGYLDDGTMVVVENGRRHIDSTVPVTVTSVLQTPAGRMIFAMVGSPDVAPPPAVRSGTRPRAGQRPTRVGR